MEASQAAYNAAIPVAPKGNTIARLPAELQLDIFDILGYQDAIILSQTNKYFNAIINPQSWPKKDKEEFVYKAQFWEKHNKVTLRTKRRPLEIAFTTDGHACFTCYRVRPKSAFSNAQTRRKGAKNGSRHCHLGHTRFCIDCGIENGFYAPGTLILRILSESYMACGGESAMNSQGELLMVCGTCQTLQQYAEMVTGMQCKLARVDTTCISYSPSRSTCIGHTQIQCCTCGELHHFGGHLHCSTCLHSSCGICEVLQGYQDQGVFSDCVTLAMLPDQCSDPMSTSSVSAVAETLQHKAEPRWQRMELQAFGETDVFEDAEEDMLRGLGI